MSERMQNLTGEIIVTIDGNKHRLGKMAGYGAQGVVYEDNTGTKMIKLYYPSGSKIIDEDILERLHFIREVKVPPNFVAIEDIVDEPYIGYVMEKVVDHKPLNSYLIPDQEMSFSEWYNKGLGFRERIFIGYIIAKAFGALEKANLSYCDISGNNILVKTGGKTASIKMIDVDNIYVAALQIHSLHCGEYLLMFRKIEIGRIDDTDYPVHAIRFDKDCAEDRLFRFERKRYPS